MNYIYQIVTSVTILLTHSFLIASSIELYWSKNACKDWNIVGTQIECFVGGYEIKIIKKKKKKKKKN